MPTPVILYVFTFLFIFLWLFGVNIVESVCLLLSNLVLYFWDELNISKNLREIQSEVIFVTAVTAGVSLKFLPVV